MKHKPTIDRPRQESGAHSAVLNAAGIATTVDLSVSRLNWGCGPNPPPGWINADLLQGPGIDICQDIREGLPLECNSLRYIVSIHALQDLPYLDVAPALEELRRVLEPGGILRL